MRYLLFALFSVLLLGKANAADAQSTVESFEFRGHRFGEPPWKPARKTDTGTCEKDVKLLPPFLVCQMSTKIGDTPAHLIYLFHRQRWEGLTISFPEPHYERMLGAFVSKYGPPDSTWTTPLQNAMGAQYENPHSVWRLGADLLELSRYSSTLNQSNALALSSRGSLLWSEHLDSLVARTKEGL
jgi:hypothetical protein